jgi:hypothetical protein
MKKKFLKNSFFTKFRRPAAVLRIQTIFIRILIPLFILIRIRILIFTLIRIRLFDMDPYPYSFKEVMCLKRYFLYIIST